MAARPNYTHYQTAVPVHWGISPVFSINSAPLPLHAASYYSQVYNEFPQLNFNMSVPSVSPMNAISLDQIPNKNNFNSANIGVVCRADKSSEAWTRRPIGYHQRDGNYHHQQINNRKGYNNTQSVNNNNKNGCTSIQSNVQRMNTTGKGVKKHLDKEPSVVKETSAESSIVKETTSSSKVQNTDVRKRLDSGPLKRKSNSGRSSPVDEDEKNYGPQSSKRQFLNSTPSEQSNDDLSDQWEKLSAQIVEKSNSNKQTQDMYARKLKLYNAVCHTFRTKFSVFSLYIVGSSLNGFGCNHSDMDMCLMLSQYEIDQRNEAVRILRNILKTFKKCSFIKEVEIIHAKVPILQFTDTVSGIQVDLNVNNTVGIRNTHMLLCYSRLDWRLSPLIVVLKLWAKAHNINDAKNMTISSYSLVLMMINFLQCGVYPAVLPCLHILYPETFYSDSNVTKLSLQEELPAYKSQNKQTIGELLYSFFKYYSNFNFEANAISVRTGGVLPKNVVQYSKAIKNDIYQWKCLSIEEPFDHTNTARSVYNESVFEKIKLLLKETSKILNSTKDLSSIFSPKMNQVK